MQERQIVRPRRADIIVLGIPVGVALLIWLGLTLSAPRGMYAVVTVEGVEVLRLPLDRNCTETVETAYGVHTVSVENGAVRVLSAPCKNQFCVAHAPVSCDGETIVCLPCSVVVTVTDADGQVLCVTDAPIPDASEEVSP